MLPKFCDFCFPHSLRSFPPSSLLRPLLSLPPQPPPGCGNRLRVPLEPPSFLSRLLSSELEDGSGEGIRYLCTAFGVRSELLAGAMELPGRARRWPELGRGLFCFLFGLREAARHQPISTQAPLPKIAGALSKLRFLSRVPFYLFGHRISPLHSCRFYPLSWASSASSSEAASPKLFRIHIFPGSPPPPRPPPSLLLSPSLPFTREDFLTS